MNPIATATGFQIPVKLIPMVTASSMLVTVIRQTQLFINQRVTSLIATGIHVVPQQPNSFALTQPYLDIRSIVMIAMMRTPLYVTSFHTSLTPMVIPADQPRLLSFVPLLLCLDIPLTTTTATTIMLQSVQNCLTASIATAMDLDRPRQL